MGVARRKVEASNKEDGLLHSQEKAYYYLLLQFVFPWRLTDLESRDYALFIFENSDLAQSLVPRIYPVDVC